MDTRNRDHHRSNLHVFCILNTNSESVWPRNCSEMYYWIKPLNYSSNVQSISNFYIVFENNQIHFWKTVIRYKRAEVLHNNGKFYFIKLYKKVLNFVQQLPLFLHQSTLWEMATGIWKNYNSETQATEPVLQKSILNGPVPHHLKKFFLIKKAKTELRSMDGNLRRRILETERTKYRKIGTWNT